MEWRRKGIYRIWIVKVMQINKREGVFVKLERLGVSLGHLSGYDDERGGGVSWKRHFGREGINEEREGRI